MNIIHRILQGTAVREHLNRANEVFDEVFTKPVREYLFTKPGGVDEVLGVAKPKIQISKDKTVLDDARMMEDLRDLVKAGAISANEVLAMVQDGTFGLEMPELIADKLTSKMKKPQGAYGILVPGKPGFAVRWDGINNSKDNIAANLWDMKDVEGRVRVLSESDIKPEVIAAITKGV